MQVIKKVVFYNDTSDFGGHEVENIDAAGYLCQQAELDVGFIFYEGNKRLYKRLSAIKEGGGWISLHPISHYSKRLQSFRTLFSIRKVRELKMLFRNLQPDLVIIAAGNVEISTLGLVATKKAGYRTVNYIPYAHKVSVIGKKYGAQIRDALNYYCYKNPDHYITISNN